MALRYSINRLAAVAAASTGRAGRSRRLQPTTLLAPSASAGSSAATPSAATAPFSTRTRRRQRGVGPRWANAQARGAQGGGDGGAHPRLQDTLRKFYLKVGGWGCGWKEGSHVRAQWMKDER